MINKGPRSGDSPNPLDKLKTLSGVKQELHHKMVADMLKHMKVKPEYESDAQRLIAEATCRIKNIHDTCELIVKECADAGKDVDRKLLAEDIFRKYIANFDHYSREELLLFIAHFLGRSTMIELI